MHEQIKELMARYIKGECSAQEIALLERWYERIAVGEGKGRVLDTADEERLVREFWKAVAAREKGEESQEGEDPEAKVHKMRSGRVRKIWRYAAVWVGVVVLSGGAWLQWRRMSGSKEGAAPELVRVSTGYQQVRKVLLPDSSVVWLNAATTLAFDPDFTTHREVYLTGEAFFQVATDAAHPFVVRAGKTWARVLGTSFNISAYPAGGEVRIALKSGKVGVSYTGDGRKGERVLAPGELLVLDKQSGEGQLLRQAPDQMDEWTGGSLLFFKTPLKEALAQIEARYGVHIIYDRVIEDPSITARFENTALEKVLQSLSFGWNLHFVRKGDVLHVR